MNLNKQKKISNSTQRIIADKLNELCELLDNLYYINDGGCCYITYCLATLLEKNGFEFKVVIYNDSHIKKRKFSNLTDNYNHYGLLLGRHLINSVSSNNLVKTKFSKVKSSDILEHYILNDWNSVYDTSKNSFISKILKSFYNDFTKDL